MRRSSVPRATRRSKGLAGHRWCGIHQRFYRSHLALCPDCFKDGLNQATQPREVAKAQTATFDPDTFIAQWREKNGVNPRPKVLAAGPLVVISPTPEPTTRAKRIKVARLKPTDEPPTERAEAAKLIQVKPVITHPKWLVAFSGLCPLDNWQLMSRQSDSNLSRLERDAAKAIYAVRKSEPIPDGVDLAALERAYNARMNATPVAISEMVAA